MLSILMPLFSIMHCFFFFNQSAFQHVSLGCGKMSAWTCVCLGTLEVCLYYVDVDHATIPQGHAN